MKEIKFIINKDGSFTATAENYKGTSCERDINTIVREAGASEESSEHKPEYYMPEVNNDDYGSVR